MFYEKALKIQSPLEERFLEDCVTVGLTVEPQYEIGGIHCDFAVLEDKIAIECDSKMYHSSLESIKDDGKRDEIYNSKGWTVIRIRGDSIYKCGESIARDIKSGNYSDNRPIRVHLMNPCPEEDAY